MLKLLEKKNIGTTLQDTGVSKNFLHRTPTAQELAVTNRTKFQQMKIKTLIEKEARSRTHSPQDGRKIFSSYTSDRG